MISKQSMLYENCNSQFWYSRRYGCLLANGKALWPDAWPIDKLMQDYAEYQEKGLADIWFAEMMNLPMASGSGLIEAEEITYNPEIQPRDHPIGFLTVDLAISTESWGHRSTIGVHSWVDDMFWQFNIGFSEKGIDPIELFWKIVEISQTWGYAVIGIESEAFQASLQFVYPHLCLVHEIDGLQFFPLKTNKMRKTERLAPWASMLKTGEYALTEGDFAVTQQLLEYDPSAKSNDDDIIDCGAYGPQMVREYYYEIWNSRNSNQIQNQEVKTSYQIAEI
jgi:hypothetical protein